MSSINKHIKETFQVTGMSCASCAIGIESMVNALNGVYEAKVNIATSTAFIDFNPNIITDKEIKKAVQDIGFDLIIENTYDPEQAEQIQYLDYRKLLNNTVGAILFSLPVFIIGMFFMHMPYGNWIMLLLTFPVITIFGKDFYINAYKQFRHGRANMDTLVAISTGIAFLFSLFNTLFPEYWTKKGFDVHVYYEASAVIISLILLGRLLESKAKYNASSAIKKLMGLQPKTVSIITPRGEEKEISIDEVKVNDIILVKPGDKIPVDGQVTEGISFVDESMITGEPIAVEKYEGTKVFAGTINQSGSFKFRAQKVGKETTLSQIIQLVREAQGSKAPVQRLVDKVAGIFVPCVISIAIVTFIVWMLIGEDNALPHALLTSITVLVIACPCALGLATPTAIIVGIGKGAENNILIKDAESLEKLSKVDTIIFDKTGTITEGKPVVSDIFWIGSESHSYHSSILTEIERQSGHPLAEAIVNRLGNNDYLDLSIKVLAFQNCVGKGILAKVDGKRYFVGNRELLYENNIILKESDEKRATEWESQGKTVVFFASEEELLAYLSIEDKIKETSEEAICKLKRNNISIHMLTGDNTLTAESVAEKVGVEHFKAEMLPTQKANYIQSLQERGKTVAMVGDGINDSQALALSDVSIAMGKGSDIAMDVAKLTLITSDLNTLPKAIKLSHQTVSAIKQNLFWAFIYNIIGIPIAAGVLYGFNGFLLNPMIAALAMALSSVSVVLNSLRIKWKKLK